MDVEFIGIDRALDNVFAKTVDTRNEDDVTKAEFGIQVNATPLEARSALTIFITPTERATLKWSNPLSVR